MRRPLIVVLGVIALMVGATAADSAVRRLAITSPVQAGGVASLRVNVTPAARCTLTLAAGTYVRKSSLGPRTGGRIMWRWRLPSDAEPGRSPVVVECGASGTLGTTYTIARAVPEMALGAAKQAACGRAPVRVQRRYKTELIPLLERTLADIRAEHGAFDCAYGSNYYKEGGPLSYYLLSVRKGSKQCAFVVTARVVWVEERPLPGYKGPVDETYVETCTTLRATG
jgi:hypothetical protein